MGRSLGEGRSRGSSLWARQSPTTSSHPKAWKQGLPSPTHAALASARTQQMGEAAFRLRKGSSIFNCSVWGPRLRPRAAGRGHVVTRAIPLSLSPDPLEQSTPPWARGFRPQRLFPPHQMKSLGTDRVEREPGSSAHHPSSSTPSLRPQTLHPCPALSHQPLNNPVTADVTSPSGWKDP